MSSETTKSVMGQIFDGPESVMGRIFDGPDSMMGRIFGPDQVESSKGWKPEEKTKTFRIRLTNEQIGKLANGETVEYTARGQRILLVWE